MNDILFSMKCNIQPILRQWQLSNVRSFDHIIMPNNYVFKAYSCEYAADVVLKIGPKSLIECELQALQYFQGEACVKLLKFDQETLQDQSSLLLENVRSYTKINSL